MAITKLTVRSPSEIRNSYLRSLRMGLINLGVANPNVTKNSEAYVRAQALADELAIGEANAVIMTEAKMPDTAQGDDVIDVAAQFGIFPRAAVGSVGPIVFESSAASPVTAGASLIDDQGNGYEVLTSGTYDDGDLISIQAVSTGSVTNLSEGSVLRWVSAPPYSAPTAEVGPGGLRDGYDAEKIEEVRSRLIEHLRTPPNGGNPQDLAEEAEKAHPSVQKAFVYPALRGPGSVDVILAARPTATNKDRDLDPSIVAQVGATISARFPKQGAITTGTVQNLPVDLAITLALPEAPSASPPGPGGGWKDGTPFPDTNQSGTIGPCVVTNVTSTTTFRMTSGNVPLPGVTKISMLDESDWTVKTATVLSYSTFATDEYTVTIDTTFVNVAVGNYIFPASVNQDTYAEALLDMFARMGPGEMTSNASALVRASRHPYTHVSWASKFEAQFTRALEDAGREVYRASLAYIYTTAPVSITASAPPIPNIAIFEGPFVYVPRNIGFYKATI